MPSEQTIKIFAGNSNRQLVAGIGEVLDVPVGKARLVRFSDGEFFCEIGENVRGAEVFVVQSTCSPAQVTWNVRPQW